MNTSNSVGEGGNGSPHVDASSEKPKSGKIVLKTRLAISPENEAKSNTINEISKDSLQNSNSQIPNKEDGKSLAETATVSNLRQVLDEKKDVKNSEGAAVEDEVLVESKSLPNEVIFCVYKNGSLTPTDNCSEEDLKSESKENIVVVIVNKDSKIVTAYVSEELDKEKFNKNLDEGNLKFVTIDNETGERTEKIAKKAKNYSCFILSASDYSFMLQHIFNEAEKQREKDRQRVEELKTDLFYWINGIGLPRVSAGFPKNENKDSVNKIFNNFRSEVGKIEESNQKRRNMLENAKEVEEFYHNMKEVQIFHGIEKYYERKDYERKERDVVESTNYQLGLPPNPKKYIPQKFYV